MYKVLDSASRRCRVAFVAWGWTMLAFAGLPLARAEGRDVPCAAADRDAFRFWTGKWDYAVKGYDPGVTTVTAEEDGCVLREEFVDRDGQQAHTRLAYDAATHAWIRTVTDPSRTYHSRGVFEGSQIHFYESPTERETYQPVDARHVRFTGERSRDGGRSWTLLFDAMFTRQSAAPPS